MSLVSPLVGPLAGALSGPLAGEEEGGGVPGLGEGSLLLPGNTSHLRTPSNFPNPGGTMSWCVWGRPDVIDTTMTAVSQWDTSAVGEWRLLVSVSETSQFTTRHVAGNNNAIAQANAYSVDEWILLAGVYDTVGDVQRSHVVSQVGHAIGTLNSPAARLFGTNYPLRVGNRNGDSEVWTGHLAGLIGWQGYALTQLDVINIYNEGRLVPPSRFVELGMPSPTYAYYLHNNTVGLEDQMGNGETLQIVGSPTFDSDTPSYIYSLLTDPQGNVMTDPQGKPQTEPVPRYTP